MQIGSIGLRLAFIITAFFILENAGMSIKFQKCNCKVRDETYLENVKCWTKPINRTFSVNNMRATLVKVMDNVTVHIQLFRKAEISYQPFLLNEVDDYCAFIAKNQAKKYLRIISTLFQSYTNLNHTCPFIGEIIVNDFSVNPTKVDSTWITGNYRLDISVLNRGKEVGVLELYAEITEKRRSFLDG